MRMPIDFYFDFSSPYSYIAAQLIEPLAARHGRAVTWRPVLLGAAFKVSGMAPLTGIPLKGDYSRRDFARTARFHGLPYRFPEPFPISTVHTARAMLWLLAEAPARAAAFARRAMQAYFADNRPIDDAAEIGRLAGDLGIDAQALLAGIQAPAIKDRLRAAVDEAVARGVFGAPFFFVDDEPFWGQDRLPQLERWLADGPF